MNAGTAQFTKTITIFGLFALLMAQCTTEDTAREFNLQGHRGCRGLMPENTIPAFIRAVEIGVNTLELDLAVSSENELIVSHEPYFNSDICLDPEGREFGDNQALEYNIYKMTYEEIAAFDCGSKPHPRFPHQENFSVSKPRLTDVIDEVHAYCRANNIPLPEWNMEIKSRPYTDDSYHPRPEVFVELLHNLLVEKNITEKSTVQSFDIRVLQAYREHAPEVRLALLIDNNLSGPQNIEKLGFVPEIYSPYYVMVTPDLVKWCHGEGMLIYPWTVNEKPAMQQMLDYGVDGLITDYPDRFHELTNNQ